MASRRGVWLFAFILVALLINLPVAHDRWTRHRIADDGRNTEVDVVKLDPVPKDDPEAWFVNYQFPEEIDPEEKTYSAQVDEETFGYADTSRRLTARYLEDDPQAHVLEGEVRNNFVLVLIALGDVALLAFFFLYLRFGRRDTTLRLLATSDIERSRSEAYAVSQVSGDEWVVIGEISKIAGDVITLVSGAGREVEVTLGEHENLVGYQQPCQVRGRELPRG